MKLKQKLNRVLKFLFGSNVVKAKRPRVKKAGYRSHVPIEDAKTCKIRESGRTHYYNDDCPGGHVDASPTQDNNINGPTS